ncbi:hypothetical protein NPIL_664021 [Nephila pilipes]|uniref:Uncharacterized protein n=1 Tax=Nephila pilipes TaxID=299642 RepID=A0A8X6TB06_NEPPI|nr:hypothetical protein NPIL_664021 [Nephila pilipes]
MELFLSDVYVNSDKWFESVQSVNESEQTAEPQGILEQKRKNETAHKYFEIMESNENSNDTVSGFEERKKKKKNANSRRLYVKFPSVPFSRTVLLKVLFASNDPWLLKDSIHMCDIDLRNNLNPVSRRHLPASYWIDIQLR